MTEDATRRPRWFTDTADNHSQWYIERFRRLEREGADLAGEARLLDAMLKPDRADPEGSGLIRIRSRRVSG